MEVIYVTSGWKHLFAGLDFHLSVARVMAHIDKDLVERVPVRAAQTGRGFLLNDNVFLKPLIL